MLFQNLNFSVSFEKNSHPARCNKMSLSRLFEKTPKLIQMSSNHTL